MNWDLATPDACPVPDAYEDIDKLDLEGAEPQVLEQIAAAKAAAKALIDSGSIGITIGEDGGAHFATEIAGVATPGQVPVNGQLPSITIRVRQVEPAPEPEPAEEAPVHGDEDGAEG